MLRYEKPLFYMIRAMVFDLEEARDITQNAFVKAFNSIKRLKDKKKFKSWLFTIGANLARDHLKAKKNNMPLEEWMEPINVNTPEKKMMCRDLTEKLKKIMESLPDRQRQVLSLRLLHELSFNEIAETLTIKPETARTNFHFGLKKLKEMLFARGITK